MSVPRQHSPDATAAGEDFLEECRRGGIIDSVPRRSPRTSGRAPDHLRTTSLYRHFMDRPAWTSAEAHGTLYDLAGAARREADVLSTLVLHWSTTDLRLLIGDEMHLLSSACQLLTRLATSADQTLAMIETCQGRRNYANHSP